MIRIIVLGAAAGGGFPQWNCRCGNCEKARLGLPSVKPATQSSIAVSGDGGRSWFLCNASPDLGRQILQTPCLHPREGLRHSPIAGAVLTNADVDHVTGLLSLRESQPLAVYGTARVQSVLKANSIFNVLNPALVSRRALPLEEQVALVGADGAESGLWVEAFAVPGKVALWLEDLSKENFGSVAEDTIGLKISDAEGKSFFYIPGCAAMPPDLAERLAGADLLFFDGTTFTDHEMIEAGLGTKTAGRMGHMCMSGPDGSMAACAGLRLGRKIYIHINNSNPVLLSDTPERAAVEAAGWSVAYDGMEVHL